jgi:hypothetical protein
MLPPKEAHGRTSTLLTCRQVEPNDVPANVSPSPMRGMDTAMLPPEEAQCRTQTLSIRRQAKPAVPPADANSAKHRGRDTAVLPPKEAQRRTPTQNPDWHRLAQSVLDETHELAIAQALPDASAALTALSSTKADADGKP